MPNVAIRCLLSLCSLWCQEIVNLTKSSSKVQGVDQTKIKLNKSINEIHIITLDIHRKGQENKRNVG